LTRIAIVVAAILCVVVGAAGPVAADPPITADVLIGAGHEGRPDCAIEPARLCNNTGAPGEIRWTPIVADVATRTLRAAGISVIRVPAHLTGPYHVRDAIFIHFDGSEQPCGSGPSIGYPIGKLARFAPHSREAAGEWRRLYGAVIPFGFENDNFTVHLGSYYGYRHVVASDAALVIEGSEITCPAQRAWQARHLDFEGRLIAYFIARRLGYALRRP
jgi:hypothetical protein